MALTTQDPESSGPFRIVTEELARVRSRQEEIVSTAWSRNQTLENQRGGSGKYAGMEV